jgi:hypothetical protein
MDKEQYFSGPDTNKNEIKQVLNFLLSNGYEFKGTREAIVGRASYPDDVIADFSKTLKPYDDKNGTSINDSSITVSIQFEKRADYINFTRDKNDDDEYIGNPESFINGLIKEIKPSISSGGSVKRKKRKTRKNKSSIFNKR